MVGRGNNLRLIDTIDENRVVGMARTEGFEPSTLEIELPCSVLLSYVRKKGSWWRESNPRLQGGNLSFYH